MDVGLGVVVLAIAVGTQRIDLDGRGARDLTAGGVVLALVEFVAVVQRRKHPWAALVVAVAVSMVMIGAASLSNTGLGLSVIVCLFHIASENDRRRTAVTAVAVAAALATTSLLIGDRDKPLLDGIVLMSWPLLAAFAGAETYSRRAYLQSLVERAEQAERLREEEARHRVVEERMRIARDLHDVVAHHIALVNLQVGVASHLIDRDPHKAVAALRGVEQTSAAALDEIRATVGLLRGPDGDDSTEPAPGLRDLTELIGQFTGAGMTVAVRVSGEPRPLGPAVDLTAYRIVQEALSNAGRHALPGPVTVSLTYEGAVLTVVVENRGRAVSASAGSGFGLRGMRERAQALGGDITAGPDADGGFRVVAQLPVTSETWDEENR
ncbi:signal transduction histidine kinase [Rhodococcus sp. 27YEA15]